MRRGWRRSVGVLAILGLQGVVGPLWAKVFMTQEEALARAFPAPHSTERRTLYLDPRQAERIEALAGSPLERSVVPVYVGRLEGRITGYAYFDTHLVRTLPETIIVRLSADGRIESIEILSFDEPQDYLPRDRWLQQFEGRRLDDDLSLKGAIHGLTGATLSSRSITAAARRILAIHRLFVAGAETGGPSDGGEEPP